MVDVVDFLSAFPNPRQVGDHYMVRCPAHEDTTASLAVKERDGRILVHCFAGCQPEAVLQAAGYSWADLFSSNGVAQSYSLRDYTGALQAVHTRRDTAKGKTFAWADASGKSGLGGTSPADLPLYGADRVSGWDMDRPIVVAEGEKAALALMQAGLQAVGTVCGASSTPSNEALSILTANDVVLWPDADQAGQQHMQRIAVALKSIAASVKVVRWPDAAAKADAADVGDPAKIRRLVELAEALPSPLRRLSAFSTEPPAPMLVERLDPTGHTILFGAGGVGKGTYAAWLAVQLVRSEHRPLVLDYEHHPEEWARRVYGLDADALPEIQYAAPLSAHWEGKRGALWEAADELRSLCIDEGITVLIIDSLAIACAGADVSDPGTPALYAAGLELLERPVLSLAHVNRAHDMTYPFGSAFWHNLARLSWSMEEDGPRAIVTPRKSNNYVRTAKVAVEITWAEGLPRSVFERPYGDTIADRIREALGAKRLSLKDVAEAVNDALEEDVTPIPVKRIDNQLRRMASGVEAEIGSEGEGRARVWFRTDR